MMSYTALFWLVLHIAGGGAPALAAVDAAQCLPMLLFSRSSSASAKNSLLKTTRCSPAARISLTSRARGSSSRPRRDRGVLHRRRLVRRRDRGARLAVQETGPARARGRAQRHTRGRARPRDGRAGHGPALRLAARPSPRRPAAAAGTCWPLHRAPGLPSSPAWHGPDRPRRHHPARRATLISMARARRIRTAPHAASGPPPESRGPARSGSRSAAAPGRWNAITDVPGVEVGYVTLIQGDAVRTGVTAIHPRGPAGTGDPVAGRLPRPERERRDDRGVLDQRVGHVQRAGGDHQHARGRRRARRDRRLDGPAPPRGGGGLAAPGGRRDLGRLPERHQRPSRHRGGRGGGDRGRQVRAGRGGLGRRRHRDELLPVQRGIRNRLTNRR